MSQEPEHKIDSEVGNILAMLKEIEMPFQVAIDVETSLRRIARGAKELAEMKAEARDIMQGLLGNWPHTEIVAYYKKVPDGPVLMKRKALQKAAEFIT